MTARLFRCNIVNDGKAPILWVKDFLNAGVWGEESLPSKTAGRIEPGQTGHYQAESGGDIPIIGNVMTGTEGWVTFRTTNTAGAAEWFIVRHWLPYWAPKTGAEAKAMRYDPSVEIGEGEFDDRDKTPPTIGLSSGEFSPHSGMAEFQSYPWLIVWSFAQIYKRPYGDFHWHMTVRISNTAPSSTTIPFPDTPIPKTESASFRASSPETWRGVWVSDDENVTVAIIPQSDELLTVTVNERRAGVSFEARDLPITRARPLDIATLFDEVPLLRPHRQIITEAETPVFMVEQHGGDRFTPIEVITSESALYGETVDQVDRELAKTKLPKPEVFGGDHLRLPEDAVLEMQQVSAEGQPIGYELRYVRPGVVPVLVVSGVDTRLHHRLIVN